MNLVKTMEFYFNENRNGESTTEVSDTFSLSSTSKHKSDYGGSLQKPKYDSLSNLGISGRVSPGHDLGYHTLLTRDSITPTPTHTPKVNRRTFDDRCSSAASFRWSEVPSPYLRTNEQVVPPPVPIPLTSVPPHRPPSRAFTTYRSSTPKSSSRATESIPSQHSNSLSSLYKGKKAHKSSPFDKLSDDLLLKIFSYLSSNHLCVCARVCRRWYFLAWEPQLWSSVCLNSEKIQVDKGLRTLFRLLCRDSPNVCLTVERVCLSGCSKLTDKGLAIIARRCPELRTLEIGGCPLVTNSGIGDIMTMCHSLQKLDLTGSHLITGLLSKRQSESFLEHSGLNNPLQLPMPVAHHHHQQQFILQLLDLTDCHRLEDSGLRTIVRSAPQLIHLYLRRCLQITDAGIKAVASFCVVLREFSISDCVQVTDFGMYELAKLGANLRYLSVAKCDQISDAGIKQIARHCYKLRYLNVRGCEAVSDHSMEVLSRSCPRLRALDIGKCDVTNKGLRLLSEHCPNLRKLSVKSCDAISDHGIQSIAFYCRGLQQLNIQDSPITVEGYRTVKRFCKRCIIEHTNPGFH